MRHINSLSNSVVKALRGLHERRHRKASGLFLAEGKRIVAEALSLGWRAKHLVILEGREDDALCRRLIRQAEVQGADIISVSAAVLMKLSRKDNPQMVLASFEEAWGDAEAAFAGGQQGLWLALDRVRDPGNLGTILRTAEAVGTEGVLLIGACCDAFSVESVRASMGAFFNMRLARMSEAAFIEAVAGYEGRVLGAALSDAAVDYRRADWQSPLILLMGNEQSGLSAGLLEASTQLVSIPMAGRSDSLNLAVATGIVLYEYRRHRVPSV